MSVGETGHGLQFNQESKLEECVFDGDMWKVSACSGSEE